MAAHDPVLILAGWSARQICHPGCFSRK